MTNLMIIWLVFNVVFGLWSARNWLVWIWAGVTSCKYNQSDLGKMLDLLIPVSIISQLLIYNGMNFSV